MVPHLKNRRKCQAAAVKVDFNARMVPSDADLVEAARAHDKDAFGELIHRHYSSCLRTASYLLRNRGEAEEEVQNACWKAYEHLDQLQNSTDFSGWLSRIVANQCLMLLRVRARTRIVCLDGDQGRAGEGSLALPAKAVDPERGLIESELAGVLEREIKLLPSMFRDVLLLNDVQQLPLRDVADRLGITPPAVKSRLFRARIELRERVARFCGPGGYHAPRSRVQVMPSKSTHCPAGVA